MLIDPYGRKITSLRISITSKCNLGCFYCHNEGQMDCDSDMSVELISDIVATAAGFGVKRVKFSGGEPLMRKDFEDILTSLPKLQNISATTNGTMLSGRAEGLKAAGLDRINISLDTLDSRKYAKICGCRENIHQMVLDGIHAAVDAGLTPVKLNMVLLDGINSGELDNVINFAKKFHGDVIVQVIEPLDFRHTPRSNMDVVERKLQSQAAYVIEREMHHRKKYFVNGVEVELVRPIDNSKFCASCNRLRVTSDGKLKPCLLRNDNMVDLSKANFHELEKLFMQTVARREPFYKCDQEITA